VIAAAYLLMAPPSADLAAALYRSELLARHGFTLWDGQWYAGHHTPAYSVLFPPLAWLVGVRVLAALSVIAAAGLFAVLLDRHMDSPSALGPVWFGGGVAVDLLTGRVAFLLGVALGLAALLRAGRARPWSAGALALLSALASPVAGAFGPGRRGRGHDRSSPGGRRRPGGGGVDPHRPVGARLPRRWP